MIIAVIFCGIDLGLAIIQDYSSEEDTSEMSIFEKTRYDQQSKITDIPIMINSLVGLVVSLYYLWRWSDDWNKKFINE